MSKGYNRLVLIIGLAGASFLAGCGVTSTTLPSNLQPGTGGPLSITTTAFPDAIVDRTYYMVISTSGGSGALSSCAVVSGTLPSGLGWSVNPANATQCILSTPLVGGVPSPMLAVGGQGGMQYSVVVQATDTSGKTDQLPYTLTVRNDFAICAGPTSALPAPYSTSCTSTSTAGTATSFPDAVQGRTYGTTASSPTLSQMVVTNLNLTGDSSPVGHPTESGNGPLVSSSITGLAPGVGSSGSQGAFSLSSSSVGAPGTYTAMVTISDSPITLPSQSAVVVPAKTLVKTYTHLVHPPLQLAQSLGASWPDAVHGRAYGTGTGCTGGACAPAVYTASNGLGGYVWPASTPASLAAVTGMSCPTPAAGSSTYTCSAASVTGGPAAAGAASMTFNPSLAVTDTANTATPAATTSSDPASTRTDSLVVDSALLASLNQNTSATNVVTDPASLLPAVSGRSYGMVNAGGGAPVYTAAGGLGATSATKYLWCVNSGVASLPTGLAGIDTNCASPASAGVGTEKLTASSILPGLTPPSQAFTFTVELDDTGNGSTPASAVSSASGTVATSLTVDHELTVTPPAVVPPAVHQRAYGQGTGCTGAGGNCAPLQYTLNYGLGTYTLTGSSLKTPTDTFTCALASATFSCSTPAVNGSSNATLTFVGADPGNYATPGNSSAPDTSQTLVTTPEMTIAAPAVVPPAVHGRAYGTGTGCSGGNCVPLTYAVTNGLGNYNASSGTLATPSDAFTGTFTSPNYAFSKTAITGAGGASPTLTFSVTETGNASTPGNTVKDTSKTLTTDAEMTLTPPTSPFPDAVVGRHYGVNTDTCGAGACAPLTYTVPASTPGLGGYTFTPNNFPSGFACAASGSSTNCSASAGVGGSPGPFSTLNMTVQDTANPSTPSNSVTSTNATMNVDAEMTLTPPASPFPAAVVGRHYGVATDTTCSPGPNCTPLTYTVPPATPGLGGPYTFTPNNFPAGFACATATNSGNCSDAAGVGGSAGTLNTLDVTVKDTANASTPQGAVTSTNGSMTVDAEITVTPPAVVPVSVHGRAYGTGVGCSGGACAPLQYTVSNGLGNYSLSGTSLATPSDAFSLTFASPTYSGSRPAIAAAGGSNLTLTFTVAETGNASTPSHTVTDTSKTLTTNAEMTVTPPAAVPISVHGRAYGTGTGCSGGACVPVQYSVSNGLGNYTLTGSSLATPSDTFALALASPTFSGSEAAISAAGGSNLGLTFIAAETGNVSTPGNTVTDTSKTLATAPEMNFTATPTSPFADAVAARTYGVGSTCGAAGNAACAPLTYTIQSGSGLGGYSYAFSPSINFACSSGAATSNCTSSGITGGANSYATAHVAVTDTANASTPSNTIASTNGSLTVHQELNFTATPTSPFAAAVDTRTYGQGSTCGATGTVACAPLTYTIQSGSGLGGYAYALVVNSGNGGFACTSGGTSSNCTSASVTETAGSYTAVHAAVTDTANASTPGNTVSSSNASLTVHSELTITPPAGVLPSAVTGRTYGQGNTCGAAGTSACATINYAVSNGLGNYVSPGTMTTTAGTFSCPLSSTTYQCASADITGSGTPTLSLSVSDTGNASTPGISKTDNSKTLPIDPEMNFTATPTSPFADAVAARTYGVGNACGAAGNLACAPLTYTIQSGSGLGGYSYVFSPSIGFTCSNGAATSNCTSTGVAGGANSYATAHVSVSDTGNASTPGTTIASSNGSLTVRSALVLNANLASPFPAAVVNRDYGVAADNTCTATGNVACTPLIYTASGGMLNGSNAYASIAPNGTTAITPGASFPLGFACNGNSPLTTLTCSAGPVSNTVGAGAYSPSVTVTDTADASTPAGNVSSPGSLSVNQGLTLGLKIGGATYTTGTTWPLGVVGRPYGAGTGCTSGTCNPPTFTATNGLGAVGGYTFSNEASLTGVGFTCTPSSPTLTCSAATLSGGFTPSVTSTDVANATTPAGTTTSDPNSIFTSTNPVTANAELAITNTFLENATVGEPYSAVLDSNRMGVGSPYLWCAGTITNGTCTPSGGIAGVSFLTTSTVPSIPPVSDDPSDNIRGYYKGTPTTAGAVATSIEVTDLGNATTPGCSSLAAPTCPILSLASLANEPKVFASQGFVANYASGATDQGDNLFLFDTNLVNPSSAIALDASGGNPMVPRVTPDGNWVYVTKPGNQKISVVDPLQGAKAINDFTVSNTGTLNPTGLDIEPQQYFATNPNSCLTRCSNLNPNIRYDAYVTDPTDGSQTSATVEPIPDAENPGVLSGGTLASANKLTVADADNIAISVDGTQAFLSLNDQPTGTPCGTPPCNTLAVLGLPALSATVATSYPASVSTTFNTFGLRGGAIAVDPRGNYVATATQDDTGTYTYLTVTSTGATPAFVTYIPTTAGPAATVNVCSAAGAVFTSVAAVPTAIAVSPDGNRLFVACSDTATPQVNDTVGVWDISGTSPGVPFIQSIALPASSGAPVVNAENGCTTPVDIKTKLTDDSTTSAYGTRLFVSCQDSDTIVPIDYNTTSDAANVYATVLSTDATAITNATLGNTTAAYTTYPCGSTGSCPKLLDLEPNPVLHFTTGGYAPTLPFALPHATGATGYSYYVVVQGGAVPRTWSNPDGVLTTDPNCAGLSLNAGTGQISGTPANTAVTCGGTNGFIVRVTDGSGQFVERTFTIPIN